MGSRVDANAERLRWKKEQAERFERWKCGVDRDLNRYYELNPQQLAMKPGRASKKA